MGGGPFAFGAVRLPGHPPAYPSAPLFALLSAGPFAFGAVYLPGQPSAYPSARLSGGSAVYSSAPVRFEAIRVGSARAVFGRKGRPTSFFDPSENCIFGDNTNKRCE